MTKICTKCKNELQATTEFFYKSGKSLQTKCKKCANIMQARWNEYSITHREEAKTRANTYYQDHKEGVKERQRIAYKKNPDKILSRNNEWRDNNQDSTILEYIRKHN